MNNIKGRKHTYCTFVQSGCSVKTHCVYILLNINLFKKVMLFNRIVRSINVNDIRIFVVAANHY